MNAWSKRSALFLLFAVAGCDTAGFKRSYMALDGEGHRRRDVFFTDTESIFCVAELASGVDDVTVRADFEQRAYYLPEDGSRVDLQRFIGSEELAPGAGEELVTSFELQRTQDQPYDAGDYACLLYLNGDLEAEHAFRVEYPECPVAPIEPGVRCRGFVLDGAVCTGVLGESCACAASGTWECA
jgi:hypothetical protein